MAKFGIMFGPVSGKIFIGKLNKANTMFLDGKEDATLEAIAAVGAYMIDQHNGKGELQLKDKKLLITAEYIND